MAFSHENSEVKINFDHALVLSEVQFNSFLSEIKRDIASSKNLIVDRMDEEKYSARLTQISAEEKNKKTQQMIKSIAELISVENLN